MTRKPGLRWLFVYEIAYLLAYIPVVWGAYALGFGPELVLLWIVPAFFGAIMCPLNFDWPVHHPHTERGRYTDSAILLFPKPIRFIGDLFFQGHSYHLMHHLYTRIPFYHYGTAYHAQAPGLGTVGAKIRNFQAPKSADLIQFADR